MARVIRARYENGVLKPLEKLDLEEDEEVTVLFIRRSTARVFGILLHRRHDLKPEDVDRVIEEIESEGVL
ncbi:MAG: antitoxin family protein [Thermoprotei archaeon]|nr:antitoxin family protein [Thermoprotei archaeon]